MCGPSLKRPNIARRMRFFVEEARHRPYARLRRRGQASPARKTWSKWPEFFARESSSERPSIVFTQISVKVAELFSHTSLHRSGPASPRPHASLRRIGRVLSARGSLSNRPGAVCMPVFVEEAQYSPGAAAVVLKLLISRSQFKSSLTPQSRTSY